jgi:SAM-dependent methyltransferase
VRPRAILQALRIRRAPIPDDPAEYWESRAPDLVDGYDHPETWARRGWMAGGVEEEVVPDLLRRYGVGSVLVVGAGTGRQYAFLEDLGISVRGFDISPTLVRAARERHPGIETVVDDVIGAEQRHQPEDAVLGTAVLQHISPESIGEAARAVSDLARRMVVLRELTWLTGESDYQWAHDYEALFGDWDLAHRVVTDSNDVCRVELFAFVPRGFAGSDRA